MSGQLVLQQSVLDEIYNYWFGDVNQEPMPEGAIGRRMGLWFSVGKSPEEKQVLDQEIKIKYEGIVLAMREEVKQLIKKDAIDAEAFNHWRNNGLFSTNKALMSAIICLDQFPRNMYRGEKESYAFDQYALALSNHIVEQQDLYDSFAPLEKVFLILPFEHSENLQDQLASVRRLEVLQGSVPPHLEKMFGGFLHYAKLHLELIEKYGRFPFRNPILGRESTKEELENKISFL